ncbi:MAG: HupE/UreJ family protein, partial [Burkholderiaceae bacterium]
MFLFSLKNAALFVILGMIGLFMTPAFAHVSVSHLAIGFDAGFVHPFSGIDHLLAMLAIGIWAAQNKRPALWVLPIV